MSNIDKMQAKREKLMKRLDNIQMTGGSTTERADLIRELKRLTAWMLDALRNGQPDEAEQAESANAHDELWRQIRTLQGRTLSLEQVGRKHEDTWRYCDRLSAFVTDLEARVHKLEQRDGAAADDDMLERIDAGRKADKAQFDAGYEELEKEVHSLLFAYGVDDCDHIDADKLDGLVGAILDTFFHSRVASRETMMAYEDFCQRTAPDTDADEAKPAPCPYCGGEVGLLSENVPKLKRWFIVCKGCGARGPMCQGTVVAKAKWNGVAGTTPADTVPSDVVRALNDAAAAAFDVIDSAVEVGYVNGQTLYDQEWRKLRDELEAAGRDVENALARLNQ